MKIAVPSDGYLGMDEFVSPHFGRAQTYTVIDSETGKVEVIENISEHMGGKGFPPELLHKKGVNVILCANLGRRAKEMFSEKGIKAYVGARSRVRDALELWKAGKLFPASEETSCKEGRHEHRRR